MERLYQFRTWTPASVLPRKDEGYSFSNPGGGNGHTARFWSALSLALHSRCVTSERDGVFGDYLKTLCTKPDILLQAQDERVAKPSTFVVSLSNHVLRKFLSSYRL